MEILRFIVVGLVAGWLAGHIVKGRGFGLAGNLVVGVIGAVLGGFLFDLLGLSTAGVVGSLVMALIGAIALLYILAYLRRIT